MAVIFIEKRGYNDMSTQARAEHYDVIVIGAEMGG
jgi:hypothetical protein